jgi:hypothetical protein
MLKPVGECGYRLVLDVYRPSGRPLMALLEQIDAQASAPAATNSQHRRKNRHGPGQRRASHRLLMPTTGFPSCAEL